MDFYRIAIPQNGLALGCVEEKYWTLPLYTKEMEELCFAAVRQNGLALQFVRQQTEEICRVAVAQTGYALEMVWPEFKTLEVCRIAWKENSQSLQFARPGFRDLMSLGAEFPHLPMYPAEPPSKADKRHKTAQRKILFN